MQLWGLVITCVTCNSKLVAYKNCKMIVFFYCLGVLEMSPYVSNMYANCAWALSHITQDFESDTNFFKHGLQLLYQPCPIESLASKWPFVTCWSFQFIDKKFMTRTKVLYYPLFIHKSNVIVIVGVTLNWGCTSKSK
jgi:hypothetical protein